MRSTFQADWRKVFVRMALIGVASGALAGCSADSSRFAAAPSPYPGQPPAPEVTGSLGAAPTGRVDTAAAPPPSGSTPTAYAPYNGGGYNANGAYGAGGGYNAASAGAQGGGQPLYGAPAYNAPAQASAPARAPVVAAAPSRPASGGVHVVASGETLTSISRSYGLTPMQLAAANGIALDSMVRVGQSLTIPSSASGNLAQSRPATPKPVFAAAPAPAVVAAAPAPAPVKPAPAPATTVAKLAPAAPAAPAPSKAAADAKVEMAAKVTPAEDADDGARNPGSGPQFRAPVRGRVISGFGPKPGGTRNDGVNFAVPEGTAVRAAEDGVVAYAGNELKDYGNLVLIKHADGYVTAYANNSELTVKRGENIRRGQIIAKSGQSGGVNAPQLHFEIRKGSQPVDPSRYVAGL